MKKFSFVLLLMLMAMCLNVCCAKEITVNTQKDIVLDESGLPNQNPPAYKQVNAENFDVKLNNPEYIKDLPPIRNHKRRVELQLKRPSIRPYQD